MTEDRNQTQNYSSLSEASMWQAVSQQAVSQGGLAVSTVLLVVSSLNIGVLVARRGLRSPNLTARLMGCLAASDFLVNALDMTLSVLTLSGRACDQTDSRHHVIVVSIIYNILHNLSSFLIAAICMERSYWLVSTIHGRPHHPPSSAAKFICIFGIAIGLMNIPPWLKLEGATRSSSLYLHTSILNWITELASLGSLVFLTCMLFRYKFDPHVNISPPVAFQLGVSKSVFLMASTNILPIIVSLGLIPLWHNDCVCLDYCVPILVSTKCYAFISALRPIIIFIRSNKLRRSFLPCLYHQAPSTAASNEMAGCTNQVGSSVRCPNLDGAATFPCRVNTSVVHCDLVNHNISISAQTVAGSMNNLYQAEGTTDVQQPPQKVARSSLLSVSWTNNDLNSRVLPLEIRSSTETLHSMASVNLPVFEHRIDVRLHDNGLAGMAEQSDLPDNQFRGDQPSRLSVQLQTGSCIPDFSPSTPRRAKSPRHGHNQQSYPCYPCQPHSQNPTHVVRCACKKTRSNNDRERALSDITTKVISNQGRSLLRSWREPNHSTRSQSLPIICVEKDEDQNYIRKASTISSILIPDNQTSLTDSSIASCAVPHGTPVANRAMSTIHQHGWESPCLPGSISTPSRVPKARFAFNIKHQHQCKSSVSSDTAPETPPSPHPVPMILWPLTQEGSVPTSRLSMVNVKEDRTVKTPESSQQKVSLCKVDVHNINKMQNETIGRPKSRCGRRHLSDTNESKSSSTPAPVKDDQQRKVCEHIRPKSSLCAVDMSDDTRMRFPNDVRPKSSLGIIYVQDDEKMRLPEDRRRRSIILVNTDDETEKSDKPIRSSLDTVDVLDEKSGVYIGTLAM